VGVRCMRRVQLRATMGLEKLRCYSDGIRETLDTRMAPVECLKDLSTVKIDDIDAELQWMIDGEETNYPSRWSAVAGKPNEASITGCPALVEREMGNVPAAYSKLPLSSRRQLSFRCQVRVHQSGCFSSVQRCLRNLAECLARQRPRALLD
jgi:hypothetical protein